MNLVVYGVLCRGGDERSAAYRLLALAAEREWGLRPLPPMARGEREKPFFPGRPDLCFNLSHSRGAAVCALWDQPVGVDVERLRAAPRRLAGGMEDEAFFRLWTAQEATIKREGRGVEALLRPLEPDGRCRRLPGLLPGCVVTVCPGEGARTVRVEPEELPEGDFAVFL